MAIKLRSLVLATVAAACLPASALAENVKIAFIDPLSGPFAPVGQGILYSWQMIADQANKEKWSPGNTFEVVGFDNKASPQESLSQLKSAIDHG